MENYKQIPQFPEYELSDLGNVRNKKGKVLSATKDQKGYRMVCLRKDGKSHTKRISKMVGILFVPNPNNKSQVNHKNGIRWDDRADNIEWSTGSENINHAYQVLNRKGSQTGKKGGLSPFAKKVVQLNINDSEVKIWDSLIEAANYFRVKRQSIKSCIEGKCKTIKNFKWKWYEEIF